MAEDSHLAAAGVHKPGSILQIVLKNFLTYKDVVIHPGARLNIVVGANGTGKSTILNAICLGLGGEPKLLGRADDAREYVMHGEEKASIEITLAPQPGKVTHVIERVIDKNRGSEKGHGRGASTFYINGEQVNVKQVRELVGDYKITIDNLCTFLPQDKVSSFSSMSEQDRLIETEKTLPGDLYAQHQELIQAVADVSDHAGDLESMQQKLKKYKHENEQLERAAALVAERQKALDQADLISKKKLWVEFEVVRDKAVQLKAEKAAIKAKCAAATAELLPLQEKEDTLMKLRQKAEANHKAHNDETNKCKKLMDKNLVKYDNHDDKIEDLITQLSELDSKRSKLEADAKAKQERLDSVQETMQGMPSLEETEAELKNAQAKRKDTMKKHDRAKRMEQEIDSQIKELHERAAQLQQMVARIENVAENRKRKVFHFFTPLSNICSLVESEKGSFRRTVWGPVACEIGAKSKEIATMLENHVPNDCLKSFVVEDKRDYDRLYNWIRKEKNLPININVVQNAANHAPQRLYSDKMMAMLKQQYGIQGYLDEFFTAPDAIMQCLRGVAKVHKVLVGNEKTLESIDKRGLLPLLAKPEDGSNSEVPYCVFAIHGRSVVKFSAKSSRYSNKVVMTPDMSIKDARFLTPGVNEREKQDTEAKLADVHSHADNLRPKIQEAQHARKQLETEAQEAEGEAVASQKRKAHITKMRGKLDQAKRNLQEALDALNSDDTEEKESLVTSLMHRVSNSIAALVAHSEQQEKMMASTIASAGAAANKSSVSAAATEASAALHEKKSVHAEMEREARQILADFTKAKKLAGDKKALADEKAPITDENGEPTQLKMQLEEIGLDNLNELDCAYEEAMAKANDIADNPDAIRQYEQRKKDIDQLEIELERRTNHEANKVKRIDEMGNAWERALMKHVSEVNKLFTTYMSEMGCTGEISVCKGKAQDEAADPGRNYKDWGIQILVSFRGQAKAQALSAERNSGGERSVCTIMYLMALQEMMVAPFRCVDEINQGLDERNERLVFRRIVANSCRAPDEDDASDHSGQYFLITPKLLPNLTDMEHEAVTLLFVMNGPHCFSKPDDWQAFRTAKLRQRRAFGEDEDEENSGNSVVERPSKKSRRP